MKRAKPDVFNKFTSSASAVLGRAWVFVTALIVLALWAQVVRYLGSPTPGSSL